jgi:hypothetical protein
VASWSGFAPPAGASGARHFEKVSPADKGQGDIVADGLTTVASTSGDGVVFNSRTPFGDTEGSGVSGQTQFLARRSSAGWSTHAITPMARPDAYQTFFAPTRLQNFSDDLSTAVVTAYDLPGSPDDTPLRNNIYVEDTATRGLKPATLSQLDPLTIFDFLSPGVWGISGDAHHLSFVSQTQLLPEAARGMPNVYKWDDGVGLSLAGVLPDGTVPAAGSDVVPSDYRAAMSADGTRQIFSASDGDPTTQLYMHIDGRRTAWVSQPEGADQSEPVNVQLQAVTPDGHNVFFVTDSPLLDDTPGLRGDNNAGPDLYRYTDSPDPTRERNLTLISHDGDVPGNVNDSGAVIGTSDDGERVYYQTAGTDLMVWDHGVTRLITGGVARPVVLTNGIAATSSRPGLGRVSPDGAYMAFLTETAPTSVTGQATDGHFEMYDYSLSSGVVTCASCPPNLATATADATVRPAVTSGLPILENLAFRPHFLSDDGQVFFSTAEALVPEDRNSVLDAYEFDPATNKVSLLSSGAGRDPTTFADASSSGNDVFLTTRQRLVTADGDSLVDVYDARVGPPLPVSPTTDAPPCDLDGCQPPASQPPSDDSLGSLFLDGPGSDVVGLRGLAVRQRVVLQGAAGTLKVRLPSSGRLRWSATGLRGGSTRRSRAGTSQLHLRLNRSARKKLKRSGSYTTVVHLTFISTRGDQVRRTTRVTFRAPAKKGR